MWPERRVGGTPLTLGVAQCANCLALGLYDKQASNQQLAAENTTRERDALGLLWIVNHQQMQVIECVERNALGLPTKDQNAAHRHGSTLVLLYRWHNLCVRPVCVRKARHRVVAARARTHSSGSDLGPFAHGNGSAGVQELQRGGLCLRRSLLFHSREIDLFQSRLQDAEPVVASGSDEEPRLLICRVLLVVRPERPQGRRRTLRRTRHPAQTGEGGERHIQLLPRLYPPPRASHRVQQDPPAHE